METQRFIRLRYVSALRLGGLCWQWEGEVAEGGLSGGLAWRDYENGFASKILQKRQREPCSSCGLARAQAYVQPANGIQGSEENRKAKTLCQSLNMPKTTEIHRLYLFCLFVLLSECLLVTCHVRCGLCCSGPCGAFEAQRRSCRSQAEESWDPGADRADGAGRLHGSLAWRKMKNCLKHWKYGLRSS